MCCEIAFPVIPRRKAREMSHHPLEAMPALRAPLTQHVVLHRQRVSGYTFKYAQTCLPPHLPPHTYLLPTVVQSCSSPPSLSFASRHTTSNQPVCVVLPLCRMVEKLEQAHSHASLKNSLAPLLFRKPSRYRRPVSPYDPELILTSSGLEPLPVAAFLHENYTHFVDESSVDDAAEAAAYLSDAGGCWGRWGWDWCWC